MIPESKVERLIREGVGPITSKWKAATGASISYRQALRHALHGKRGQVLESLKLVGRRVTSTAAVLRFIQALEDAAQPAERRATVGSGKHRDAAADAILASHGLGRDQIDGGSE